MKRTRCYRPYSNRYTYHRYGAITQSQTHYLQHSRSIDQCSSSIPLHYMLPANGSSHLVNTLQSTRYLISFPSLPCGHSFCHIDIIQLLLNDNIPQTYTGSVSNMSCAYQLQAWRKLRSQTNHRTMDKQQIYRFQLQ